jgi:hypothetical protein
MTPRSVKCELGLHGHVCLHRGFVIVNDDQEFGMSIYLSVMLYYRWTSDHFITPLTFFQSNTSRRSYYFCGITPSKKMQSEVKKIHINSAM